MFKRLTIGAALGFIGGVAYHRYVAQNDPETAQKIDTLLIKGEVKAKEALDVASEKAPEVKEKLGEKASELKSKAKQKAGEANTGSADSNVDQAAEKTKDTANKARRKASKKTDEIAEHVKNVAEHANQKTQQKADEAAESAKTSF